MKVAVRLVLDYEKNLFITENTDFEQLKTFFDNTPTLTLEQKHEVTRISTIEWHVTSQRSSTLLQ